MLWICPRCGTHIREEGYDICWNCMYTEGDNIHFPDDVDGKARAIQIKCLKCKSKLEFLGYLRLSDEDEESDLYDSFALLIEILSVPTEHQLEYWECPNCQYVELFHHVIGAYYRPVVD